MIFYFTGTGNSKWVAKQLADKQQDSLLFIPEEKEGNISYTVKPDEKIGFVFPIYSWGPPKIVLDFIRMMNIRNYHNHYIYFVCTCGDDIGLAKDVFCKAVSDKGWQCNAGFSVIMPNNYVLFPGFDTDTKELERKKLSEAIPVLQTINDLITVGEKSVYKCKSGRFAWIKTRLIYPSFRIYPQKFHVTDTCVSCKKCESVCPVGNVKVFNRKPVWGSLCTSCLACYHICPEKSVQYGKVTQNKGQYFNPEIRKEVR